MINAQQIYASRLAEIQEKLASKQAKVQQFNSSFQNVLNTKMEVPEATQNGIAANNAIQTGDENNVINSGTDNSGNNDNSLSSMMQSMMSLYSASMMSSSLSALGGSGGGGGLGDSMSSMMSMMMMAQMMEKLTGTQDTQSNANVTGKVEQYSLLIDAISEQYDLDPNLVKGLVQAESGFTVDAVSPSGAQGLMQLMPGTAAELGVTDSFDPVENLNGGMKYLSQHLETFNGDAKLALAAYNCGAARLQQLGITSSDDAEAYGQLSTGVRDYVETVMKYARAFGYSA